MTVEPAGGGPGGGVGAPPPPLRRPGTVRPFGIYVHVPFCASRCGYCDFNTYLPREVAGGDPFGAYLAAARAEIRLAAAALAGAGPPPVDTVFLGGGTPTLLPPDHLAALLAEAGDAFGLRPGAEVTVEANPESVDAGSLAALRAAGCTRVSLGMQSARPHVLGVLDRRHSPGRAVAAAAEARAVGFEHVSLDLIYGTPGETEEDWAASVGAAVGAGVDHVSAYALVVERGTALARRVAAGQVPAVDDDVLARRYEAADAGLAAAGLGWYEVSNWARTPDDACRHNLGYWRSADWWGVGPGAHSHVGGVRWWNERRPETYASRLATGTSPAAGWESLTPLDVVREEVMLRVRLAEGLPLAALPAACVPAVRRHAATLVADGLLEPGALRSGVLVLTLRGRLLADGVVRGLWDALGDDPGIVPVSARA